MNLPSPRIMRQFQDQFWQHDYTNEVHVERQNSDHMYYQSRNSTLALSFNAAEQDTEAATGTAKPAGECPIPTFEDVQIVRGLLTRNLCCIGLCFGWAVAIICIALSTVLLRYQDSEVPAWLVGRAAEIGPNAYIWLPNATVPEDSIYLPNHRVFSVPQGLTIIVALLLNVSLTLVFDMINMIHATSLRWQLWREARLDYSSNPRLFTSTKRHGPNKWYSNILSALAAVFSYGGLSILSFQVTVLAAVQWDGTNLNFIPEFDGPQYGIDFNGWGFLGLGTGLLLQSILSTWCLIETNDHIETWSSNPLAIARACKHLPSREDPTEDAQNISSIELNELSKSSLIALPNTAFVEPAHFSQGRHPKPLNLASTNLLGEGISSHSSEAYQRYARSSTPDSHNRDLALPQSSSQLTVCSLPQKRQQCARSFIPECKRIVRVLWAVTALVTIWTLTITILSVEQGTATQEYVANITQPQKPDGFNFLTHFGEIVIYYDDLEQAYTSGREWIGLLVQVFAIALPILALHYAEVLVLLSRDEAIWRRASTDKGADADSMILVENVRFWPVWVFFVIKCLIPWAYGMAITSFTLVSMTIIPLSMVTFLFWVLTFFLEWLVRHQPRGFQPPTYGNIRGLIELVDDWSRKKIYWGEKGEYPNGIKLAGTAGHQLPPLIEDGRYAGLWLSSKAAPAGMIVDVAGGMIWQS